MSQFDSSSLHSKAFIFFIFNVPIINSFLSTCHSTLSATSSIHEASQIFQRVFILRFYLHSKDHLSSTNSTIFKILNEFLIDHTAIIKFNSCLLIPSLSQFLLAFT